MTPPNRRLNLYDSKAWLERQYQVLRKSPEEIAQETGASRATIYRKLKEFGFIR
jgi:transcriptional regulator of acetoin/glycerol metabolism